MSSPCYLTLVAASRNDDHGGDLLRRTQIFVSGVQAQMERFQVNAELLLVDWNPPLDREPLEKVLAVQKDNLFCPVKFLRVSPEIHNKVNPKSPLPFYQMIAKNVGIKRADGEYVLCTNIDILLSDALMKFLASKSLKPKHLYRCDRVDVKSDIPAGPVEEQLAYCKQNVLRVNHRKGTSILEDHSPVPPAPQVSTLRKFLRTPRWLKDRYEEIRLLGESSSRTKVWEMLSEFAYRFLPLPQLHTNGCGDFTLMSKKDWFNLKGYFEFPIYSMHLDSLLLHEAHKNHLKEVQLSNEEVIYHIEHAGGWTPENSHRLFSSLKSRGVDYLTYGEFRFLAWKIHRGLMGKPPGTNWGLEAWVERTC